MNAVPQKLRFGLIGCSRIARRRFIPAIRESTSAQLVHIGSRSAERASEFADLGDCKRAGSYDDVLGDPDVAAVYISTPPSEHERWTLRAAAAGKHVWCEKPAAPNLKSTLAMIRACRNADIAFMEGYSYRFHPQHSAVSAHIRRGVIGVPCHFFSQFTYPNPPPGDHRLDSRLGGGVFLDSAGYGIAAAIEIFKVSPQTVGACLGGQVHGAVDAACALTLHFEGDRFAQVFTGSGLQFRSRYVVIGSLGSIELARAFAVPSSMETHLTIEVDHAIHTEVIPGCDLFRIAIDRFSDAVRNPEVRRAMWEFSEVLGSVMDAALRSAREKRLIDTGGMPCVNE